MSLTAPWLLVPGVLVVAALAVAATMTARRRRAALAAAGVDAAAGRRGPQLGIWLSLIGIAVLTFAAAGPAASVPVSRAAGTVIVAVDVSNSMGATDVTPTRLDAAKKAAAAFVAAQPDSVDVGVVAFQDGALTTHQPSADHAAAEAAIDRLKVTGGTSLAEAILTSLSAITGRTVRLGADGSAPDLGYWSSATIVLFSDGEDGGAGANAGTSGSGGSTGGGGAGGGDAGGGDAAGATEAAAGAAQAAGVHVETVGVGTTAGATVEVDGYRLHTALDEDTLKAIAQTTGGSYHPASQASELDGVASAIDLRRTTQHEDLPLAGAFTAFAVLLLAAGAVPTILRTGRVA
ncbi:Ca-activated chloride channel family protein [Parafrankia irregularis]|uniref:Ca-activated chloride channel family protein n=1 Tax=Parafrankia irregularis TaxID=795642 RepID=A0A0S4QRQ1_9ACTN|nr:MULTISPECIES: VWA domain-containing protein [Parafrankia]MBE3205961.1 VWA domain-containing protein [Parafrankia sp. CH37]CUU57162.1 Ca-activated chloride channel family protein [Parafrankia irregularis]